MDPVDLIVLGGGIAGMSTALAAVKLNLSVVVVEQGTLCGQGATAAAKQGQVNTYEPKDDETLQAWDDAFRYRWESLLIYQEMEAMGHDLGLRQHGGSQVYLAGGSLASTFGVKLQWYVNWLALSYGKGTKTSRVTALPHRGLGGLGLLHDGKKAHVTPCAVLAAWRDRVVAGGGEILEGAAVTSVGFADGLHAVGLGSGARRARALVLALGTWHNRFVREHLPSCVGDADITAVAGQIAIYDSVAPPIAAHAPIVDYADAPWAVAGILSQSDETRECPWAPADFLTECPLGRNFANYLYATQWGGTRFSIGSRRVPIEEPERCWGDSWQGGDTERGFQATGVAYDDTAEEWALDTAVEALQLQGSSYTRAENYTACFPVAKDGEVHARPLACANGLERVFVLNGLAGGGIARGPAAGRHVAEHVAAALGRGPAPHVEVPFYSGAGAVLALVIGLLVALIALLSCCAACCFCVDWLKLNEDFRGPTAAAAATGQRKLKPHRRHDLRAARQRRACCVSSTTFIVLTTLLFVLVAATAIAVEGGVFLLAFLCVYVPLNLVLCSCCLLCPTELARCCFPCWAVSRHAEVAAYVTEQHLAAGAKVVQGLGETV